MAVDRINKYIYCFYSSTSPITARSDYDGNSVLVSNSIGTVFGMDEASRDKLVSFSGEHASWQTYGSSGSGSGFFNFYAC